MEVIAAGTPQGPMHQLPLTLMVIGLICHASFPVYQPPINTHFFPVWLEEIPHGCYNTLLSHCAVFTYFVVHLLAYRGGTAYSLEQSFCVLFGLCGYGFYSSFVFMPLHALAFPITSQLIINELGFGSGALRLSNWNGFPLSFLSL